MATLTAEQLRQQNRRTTLKEAKRNAWAYVFISPFYILYAVFGMFPLLFGLWLSFHEWDGISPMKWVGLENYTTLLVDDIWWKTIYNTIWLFFAAWGAGPFSLDALLARPHLTSRTAREEFRFSS